MNIGHKNITIISLNDAFIYKRGDLVLLRLGGKS